MENAFVCEENSKISNNEARDETLESKTVLTKDCFDRMWSRVVQQMITQFTRNSVHEIEINITITILIIFVSPPTESRRVDMKQRMNSRPGQS